MFLRPIFRSRIQSDAAFWSRPLDHKRSVVVAHWIAPDSLSRRNRSFCALYSSGVCPEDAAISSSSRVSGARCECGLPVVIEGVSRVGGALTGGPAYCLWGGAMLPCGGRGHVSGERHGAPPGTDGHLETSQPPAAICRLLSPAREPHAEAAAALRALRQAAPQRR